MTRADMDRVTGDQMGFAFSEELTLEKMTEAANAAAAIAADARLAAGAHAVAIDGELEPGEYPAVLRAGATTEAAPGSVVRTDTVGRSTEGRRSTPSLE